MNERHMEHFGPDLGRGPFSSQRIETSALQIATAIAQVRFPLSRSDDDIRAHASFVRELADLLAPDWAAAMTLNVGPLQSLQIQTTIRVSGPENSLLECWLADSVGQGPTAVSPNSVTWNADVVIETLAANRWYRVLTPSSGVAIATVTYAGVRNWYWAISRYARVFYSARLTFV